MFVWGLGILKYRMVERFAKHIAGGDEQSKEESQCAAAVMDVNVTKGC